MVRGGQRAADPQLEQDGHQGGGEAQAPRSLTRDRGQDQRSVFSRYLLRVVVGVPLYTRRLSTLLHNDPVMQTVYICMCFPELFWYQLYTKLLGFLVICILIYRELLAVF